MQLVTKTEKRTKMKTIPEINESEFEAEVLRSERPVLVSFWAAWSQSCRVMGPVLDQVAGECNGMVKVVKVNVDDNPDLGMWYGIQSIPTLLCFINGNVGSKIVGTASKEAILAKLQSLTGENKPTTEQRHIQQGK
jgi:thioredoxin 1